MTYFDSRRDSTLRGRTIAFSTTSTHRSLVCRANLWGSLERPRIFWSRARMTESMLYASSGDPETIIKQFMIMMMKGVKPSALLRFLWDESGMKVNQLKVVQRALRNMTRAQPWWVIDSSFAKCTQERIKRKTVRTLPMNAGSNRWDYDPSQSKCRWFIIEQLSPTQILFPQITSF